MMKLKKKERYTLPKRNQGGQTMIMTVMLISSAILGATVLAALLVLFQLRQASDSKASTQAIFAADSGIECILFEKLLSDSMGGVPPPDYATNCGEKPGKVELDNGAFYTVIVDGSTIKSVGRAGRTSRAFEITF